MYLITFFMSYNFIKYFGNIVKKEVFGELEVVKSLFYDILFTLNNFLIAKGIWASPYTMI